MGFRGEYSSNPSSEPASFSRRDFLIGGASLAVGVAISKQDELAAIIQAQEPLLSYVEKDTIGAAMAAGAAVVTHSELFKTPEQQEPPKFSPDRIGINLNYRNFYRYEQNPQELLPKLLAFPGKHVRVSVYLDEIFRNGQANFEATDKILDMCLKAGKKLHLVLGTKTTGGDEFNHSPRFLKECPEASLPDAVIGSTQKQRDILTEEVGKVAEHYLFSDKYGSIISSVHRTNEGYSKRLVGVTGKSVDPIWNFQEHDIIQKLNRFKIPIVQNVPTDTWENVPAAMSACDIPAINVYPQAWRSNFGDIGDRAAQAWFWSRAHKTFEMAKENENGELSDSKEEEVNGFFIAEAQIAPWLDSNLQPKYSFDKKIVMDMLKKIQEYNPAIVFLWDMEQHYKNDDVEFIQQLHELVI